MTPAQRIAIMAARLGLSPEIAALVVALAWGAAYD